MSLIDVIVIAGGIFVGTIVLGLMFLGMLVVAKVITFAIRSRVEGHMRKGASDESNSDIRFG